MVFVGYSVASVAPCFNDNFTLDSHLLKTYYYLSFGLGDLGSKGSETDTRWLGNFLDEKLFWTNKTDLNSFVRILDYLFEVDDIQWHKDVSDSSFSSLMVCDPRNKLLKSILEKKLGSPPETKNILP
jgi:hypothetical protein